MKPHRSFTIREQPAPMSAWKRCGFTLVELLTVLAVMALLISLLLPSLARSREMGRRVVCLSGLHQQQVAAVAFGGDNAEKLPPDQHGRWGPGIGGGALMMVPAVYNIAPYGNYAGQGILMTMGYLPKDGVVLYCPSFSYPDMQRKAFTGQLGVGFQAGLQNGGGWWPDASDIPANQHWLKSAYFYRNLVFTPTGTWAPLTVRSRGNEPIIADHFNFIPAVISKFQHGGQDYMTVTVGGEAYAVHDEKYEIRDYKGGATYSVGSDQLLAAASSTARLKKVQGFALILNSSNPTAVVGFFLRVTGPVDRQVTSRRYWAITAPGKDGGTTAPRLGQRPPGRSIRIGLTRAISAGRLWAGS